MKSYEAIKPNMHELISVSRAETMNKLAPKLVFIVVIVFTVFIVLLWFFMFSWFKGLARFCDSVFNFH